MKLTKLEFYQAIDRHSGRPYSGRRAAQAVAELQDIPQDMLRYDLAFVNPAFPDTVLFVRFRVPSLGSVGGTPTLGRWSSFGITLRRLAPPFPDDLFRVAAQGSAWVTYRHPRDSQQATDYTTLRAVPLATFLTARSFEEVD